MGPGIRLVQGQSPWRGSWWQRPREILGFNLSKVPRKAGSCNVIFLKKKIMALPKPENQPYAIIFRVHNKQKKLSFCVENNSDIVCGVRPMINDSPISTGKSTLCCKHFDYTTNKQRKMKTKNKTKQKKIIYFMENNFEIVSWCASH